MAMDFGIGANGLPEFRGQQYFRSEPDAQQVRNFADNPSVDENEVLRIFAGALAMSKTPVYRLEINGNQEKVVDANSFNQNFTQMRGDPIVQKMAHDFASSPQYREKILHGNNEATASGMVANISKELISLKKQEAQIQERQEENNLRQHEPNLNM